ncbi:MAG: polymerase subunit chi [Noviherbaspirillum sp.]|nr:polymerase subunit chi [Noviherbaspirillum sp.]MDB5794367.1 polymerase subunit chi [Noviherbaspirillum sp.]
MRRNPGMTNMTRIDFHSNVPDKFAYTCRLVRKARAANCRVVLLTRDQADLAALDRALWTFSDLDFLPHAVLGEEHAAMTPVVLTDNDTADLPHHQILINLSAATPAHFARFERMFEIISADEDDKSAGRERYRFYQQRGYPLTHFVAEKS